MVVRLQSHIFFRISNQPTKKRGYSAGKSLRLRAVYRVQSIVILILRQGGGRVLRSESIWEYSIVGIEYTVLIRNQEVLV